MEKEGWILRKYIAPALGVVEAAGDGTLGLTSKLSLIDELIEQNHLPGDSLETSIEIIKVATSKNSTKKSPPFC